MARPGLPGPRARVGILSVLALLSGCCALAYEILYMRALTTILGDMFYVHAALLSAFLVGIGLGAKVAHRCHRWLYAFEILTGLYAMALPGLSRWFAARSFFVSVTGNPYLTIIATVGFLALPSLLIGFSIPLFSAYIKAHSDDRLAFQGVYKLYNLGALLSILVVEFSLVRLFGVSKSLVLVGTVNLMNGVILIAMRAAPAALRAEMPRHFPRHRTVALALASMSSAVFQMFFLKLCYLVFGPHRENFAIGLSVIMLGIFLGAWLASKVRIRFGTLLVLVPALIGLTYVCYLPILQLYQTSSDWAYSSGVLFLADKFVMGCIFALGPMILFGALIPALMRSETEVAEESGHLLFVSSLANAAGYLIYVLVGHPLLTSGVLLALIAGTTFLASLLATRFRWSMRQGGLALVGSVLVVALVLGWRDRNIYLAQMTVDSLRLPFQVTNFKSGAENATLVQGPEYEWVSYNGFPSVYATMNGVPNLHETEVGVIPSLCAPRLDRALVLGMGTGISAGATSRVFNATDVVEINDAFYKMMHVLKHANLDIEHNPAATLYLADGRAFLVGKKNAYDAVLSTVSAPTYFSASKIYTLDFYRRVDEALKPGGVFCTWLSSPDMSEEGLRIVLSALRRVFAYCDLRLLHENYYLVTCSNQPLRRPRRFSELPAQKNLIDQLQACLPGFDLDEYFEDIRLSDNIFAHYEPTVRRENTDDHPVLEFEVVRSFQRRKMGEDLFFSQEKLMNIDPVRKSEVADPARLGRRAGLFHIFGPEYFERDFKPLLGADPAAQEAMQAWITAVKSASRNRAYSSATRTTFPVDRRD